MAVSRGAFLAQTGALSLAAYAKPAPAYSKEMMEGTSWRCPAAGGASAEFM